MSAELIHHRYEVLELINESEMAVVLRAFDRSTRTHVALKRLKLSSGSEQSANQRIARFQHEYHVLQKFQGQPNVVQVLEEFKHGQDYYIAMEYIDNSLANMIETRPHHRLPVVLAVSIAYDLAKVLDRAHKRSIIHCDIKPSNVLISNAGIVKLADFGVSHSEMTSSRTGLHVGPFRVGTIQYWPPEACKQNSRIEPNKATDAWSFGIMLYEIITGRNPFLSSSEHETRNLIRSYENGSLSIDVPDVQVPPELERLICSELLERASNRRAASFDAIANRLEQIYRTLTGMGQTTPFVHTPLVTSDTTKTRVIMSDLREEFKKENRQNRSFFVFGSSIAIIGIVIGAYFSYQQVQLQIVANDQAQTMQDLEETIQALAQLDGTKFAQTLTAVAPENAQKSTEPTATSVPASHTPAPTLMPTPTDEPTSTSAPTLTPSLSPSLSPTPAPTTPAASFTPASIRALQDVSGTPCQAKVEDGKPFAEVYPQPDLGEPIIDRLSGSETARVEEVLSDWIGINLHKKHVYVLDDQVQTYGDCDELFINSRPRTTSKAITAEPTLAASPTPTPSPEPTPTPTRPRPTRLAPTHTPTDVPTPVYVPPPITQNPPADLPRVPTEQPAQPPAATNTNPPPTAVPQPTNPPPPSDTPIPPNTPVPTTPPPDPTLPPSLPTNEPGPTPTRGIIIIGP